MVKVEEIKLLGKNLNRPECILVSADRSLHVADWRGGVTVISQDSITRTILADADFSLKPNGIAILADSDGWLVTHLGDTEGGVYNLDWNGQLRPFLLELYGELLPPTNYVHVDHLARVWITVSTRLIPRIKGCRPDHSDGFIILVDKKGPRIVADNLGYTNECLVDSNTNRLYVNETFGRRLSCFDICDDGSLKNKRVICEFGFGNFPDGLTFDEEGGIWITSIVSNRVIRVLPTGEQEIILEDNDLEHLEWVEEAYLNSKLERRHLDVAVSKVLKNVSSLAFGGDDMKTVYLGCLQGNSIPTFKSKIKGLAPFHWNPKKWEDIKIS